jgi:hypothetical protein
VGRRARGKNGQLTVDELWVELNHQRENQREDVGEDVALLRRKQQPFDRNSIKERGLWGHTSPKTQPGIVSLNQIAQRHSAKLMMVKVQQCQQCNHHWRWYGLAERAT